MILVISYASAEITRNWRQNMIYNTASWIDGICTCVLANPHVNHADWAMLCIREHNFSLTTPAVILNYYRDKLWLATTVNMLSPNKQTVSDIYKINTLIFLKVADKTQRIIFIGTYR